MRYLQQMPLKSGSLRILVEAAVSQNYFCVVGNVKTIQDEEAMFDKIEPLFKQKED